MIGTGLLVPALYVSAILAFLLSIFWRPRVGLYFLVPLLPLQVVRFKILALPLGSMLVHIILLGVVLGLLFRGESLVPPALPLKKILFIFVLFNSASVLYGSFYLGFPLPLSLDNPRFEAWLHYMMMPALYFVTVCAIKNVRQMKVLILLMCLSLLVIDRGFYLSMMGRDLSRYTSSFSEAGALGYAGSNGLGAFEAQISLFLLGLYALARRKAVKLGILTLLLTNMYCLLFSFSRGGYIGFLVGLGFLGLFKERKLLIVVLALLIGWQTILPNSVGERIAMTYNESGEFDSSVQARLSFWEDASQLFLENPIFGTGFNTYQYMRTSDTHNIYLKLLVETGLIGLMLLLWLMLSAFRLGFRLFRSEKDTFLASVGLGFAAMLVCAFVVNFFGDRWTYLQVNAYLWTLLACVARGQMIVRERIAEREKDEDRESLIAELPRSGALMAKA